MRPPRTPWPATFPDVVIHTNEAARDAHHAYRDGKAGDPDAATVLVQDLLNDASIAAIGEIVRDRNVIVAPASAIERQGFNAIPDAMALELARRLGLQFDPGELHQTNVVSHTRARGFYRLSHPAAFSGVIQTGRDYLMVDDHVGLGGTIASLKGYIEVNGGSVIGCTALTDSKDSRRIALSWVTLEALRGKHGKGLEEFWQERFGHGLECLTEPEAGYLLRSPSLVRIRNQVVKAAKAASA